MTWANGVACCRCGCGLHWNNTSQTCKMLEICGHLYHEECLDIMLRDDVPKCTECGRYLSELGQIITLRSAFCTANETPAAAAEERKKREEAELREEIEEINRKKAEFDRKARKKAEEAFKIEEETREIDKKLETLAKENAGSEAEYLKKRDKSNRLEDMAQFCIYRKQETADLEKQMQMGKTEVKPGGKKTGRLSF